MSEERAVHRDCRNASNPYHECSDYCFRVIAEAIIRMQHQESATKQVSLQQGVRLLHNMSEERAVHRDCRNASNPYHECSDYCFRVIAEAIVRMQQQESEVAQASGGSGREQAVPDESYPNEGMHDDRPKPEEDSDSDPDQPAVENMDGAYPKLSARQKKWMELRAKMQEAKKGNQIEIAAEKKRMEAPTESRGVSKHNWLDDRKRKIGKLLDANGLDLTKAYMLDTQEAAEEKYKKWEKDPAPVGWDVTLRFVRTKGESWKEMAQNIRVMPNCVYASNPYHECTENCQQKLKESKPPKNKKSSDYCRRVTADEMGKKMNEEKRMLSGCPKASNPYHVRNEYCQKTMSGADSGAIPLNFSRKKKLGSKPEHPVLGNIPASKTGAIYLADAASPISNYYEKEKLEPKINELVPPSGEIHAPDVMPNNQKVQPKDGSEHLSGPIPTKQAGDKNPSPKVVPVTSYDDTGEGLSTSATGSKHFCYSGVLHDDDDSDGEESQSVVSESRVPVGKYRVKESFAPILLSIFDKYGDIGEGCHLESDVMRSYYIECVRSVVQELQSTSIMELSKSKVKELLAILNDVESAQLRVAWLRSIVNEIAENIELINEHHAVEVAKANFDREMESLRKELESEEETLAQKEQEITDTKTRIEGIRERLSELELKASDLETNMLSIKSKADNLDSRSLLNELL